MKIFNTMLKAELKLSLRGIDMLIFAICMPVVILILLGIIYGNKPAFEGAEYSFFDQSFAAVATIAICGGGVMGLPLVISDYRQKKILKRFRVTPVSPAMILCVQLVIYTLYALCSLLLLFAVAVIFFEFRMRGSWLQFFGIYFLVLFSMFSIGLMTGGIAKNTKSAGIIASILYFPMLIFSGSTLPYEVMPVSLQKIAGVMPLTHGIKLLKASSLGLPLTNISLSLIVMIVIGVICTAIAIKFFKWE